MSTIRVDNFQASDGLTPSVPLDMVPRMGLHYVQTTPTTVSSENVTSVSDNGAGDYTITITNAFADATYTVVGTDEDGSAGGAFTQVHSIYNGGIAAGSLRCFSVNGGSNSGLDSAGTHTLAAGALA